MSKQFGFDLRLARKQSGFRQSDVAHLVGIGQNTLSDLENGIYPPSLVYICTLSLIYGQGFEQHVSEVLDEAREALRSRLETLPPTQGNEEDILSREESLIAIEARLADQQPEDEIS